MSSVTGASSPWRSVTAACFAVLWVFISMGLVAVGTPLHIVHELGGTESDVGGAAMAFGVTTVAVRLGFSPFLNHFSQWRVIVVAAIAYAAALAAGATVESVGTLILLRVVAGGAEGIFYLAAASAVSSAVPESQRGRALSYFSVSLFAGIAIGPVIAEVIYAGNEISAIWLTAALFGGLAAATVAPLARRRLIRDIEITPAPDGEVRRTLRLSSGLTKLTVWCTVSMSLGTLGYGGFQTLLPLVGREAGLAQTGGVFAFFAVTSVVVRASSAHMIDRLPSYPTAVGATVLTAAVMTLLAISPSIMGLHVAAVGLAISLGVQYPVLLKLALANIPQRRQPQVIALYSSSFDIGMALGALLMGAITEAFGFGSAAGVVAMLTIAAILLQIVVLRPYSDRKGA